MSDVLSAVLAGALNNKTQRTLQDIISANDVRKVGQALGTHPRITLGSYIPAQNSNPNNWGLGSATSKRYFLNAEQQSRIRQKGTATKISIFVHSLTGTTNFYFSIWRLVGASNNTWIKIYEEDIFSKIANISDTVQTIELAQPVKVEEGDFTGYGFMGQTGSYAVTYVNGNDNSYYLSDVVPNAQGFNWTTANSSGQQFVPITVFGNSPDLVTIGDSIIAGHPSNLSLIETTAGDGFANTIAYNIANPFGWTYQNMGIGGQTSSQISARFQSDVVAMKPSVALIEGGVNDINLNSTDQTGYINNMKSMLDACVAAGIIPVVLKILPWTAGTTAQNQTRDSWNNALANLVNSYRTAILVDANSVIGQFRSGGDTGNLWDINPTYGDGSGIHYNATGYQVIGQTVANAIKAKWLV